MLLSLSVSCCSPPSVEVAFSPSPRAKDLLKGTIVSAEHTIDIATFYLSSWDIANELIAAQHHGVRVRVVVDGKDAARSNVLIEAMRREGIEIRINNHYLATGARMHLKYMIVDDKTVQTGSFNYNVKSEESNAENVVVVANNPGVAAKYHKDWQKHWDEAAE